MISQHYLVKIGNLLSLLSLKCPHIPIALDEAIVRG